MNLQINNHGMELSVIIVSFNVSDFLKQCLLSVKKATENIHCEIFVVDNNSADDSCSMVEREFPEIILIKNKVNSGFSAANNQGIKQANGQYVLLLNPDTLVQEDTFTRSINFMNGHPDAGAMGVRMINGEGRFLPESKRALPTPETAFFKAFGISFLFSGSRFFNRYYLPHIDSFETSTAEIISGAYMFIRREALSKTGFLDEDFFMYGEDIDMSYRLLQAGYNNYYFPEIQIVHYKGKSTGRDNFTDIFHFYRAMRIYIRKRSEEGKFNSLKFLIIPAIYFREGLALLNRLFRITLKR
jgi:GT2 family glycosyltransferase